MSRTGPIRSFVTGAEAQLGQRRVTMASPRKWFRPWRAVSVGARRRRMHMSWRRGGGGSVESCRVRWSEAMKQAAWGA
jgi:hypothetical protein